MRQVGTDFEMQFRYFMTTLNFGVDLIEATANQSISSFLRLNEDTFFGSLYEPFPDAERRLSAYLQAGDLLVYVQGRPGSGKSSLVRKVVRTLESERRLHHVIVLDFLRDRDSDSTPDGMEHWLRESILEKAWKIYQNNGQRAKTSLALFFLSHHERRNGATRIYNPSTSLLEAVKEAERVYQESVVDEAAISLREWFESELRAGQPIAKSLQARIRNAADARDVLYAHAAQCEPGAPKVVIVFDNLDSIPRPDTACACRDWIRSNAMRFLDSSVFVSVIRPENAFFLAPRSSGDPTAVRFEVLDLDDFVPQYTLKGEEDQDASPAGRQRSERERRICERRLDYLLRWYQKQGAQLPDDVRGLFAALWVCRRLDRIRQDADALSNWNNRVLASSLGSFAKELYLHFDIDWSKVDLQRDNPLTPAQEIHVESMYYAWLSGAFPSRGSAHFDVREYNPAGWHWFIAESEALQSAKPRFLFAKGHHITLAAVYNAANMSARSPIQPASTVEVLRRLGEIGFSAEESSKFIRDLIFPSDGAQAANPRHAGASQDPVQRSMDENPWNRFGDERRYLLQAVDGNNLFAVEGAGMLPKEIMITDRGRQILEYIGVKLHFVVGLLDQKFRIREPGDFVWSDPASSPVPTAVFARVFERFERMAAFHVKCLEEAREHLWPRVQEGWLEHLRAHCCLSNVTGSRYASGGNLFFDRLLLSIEKYLERMNKEGLKDDPSPNYLPRIRTLRKSFGDYVDEYVKPNRQTPGHARPEWLSRYEQAMVTLRNQRKP